MKQSLSILIIIIATSLGVFFMYKSYSDRGAHTQSANFTQKKALASSTPSYTDYPTTHPTTTLAVSTGSPDSDSPDAPVINTPSPKPPTPTTKVPKIPYTLPLPTLSPIISTAKPEPILKRPPSPPASILIQDLSSKDLLAEWTAGPNSAVSADPSFSTQGTQSLTLTSDGQGDSATAKVLYQGPYNLRGQYLEIWIRVSSATNLKNLWFKASSDNMTENFFTWKLNTQIFSSVDESEIQPNEWVPIVLTFDSDGQNMVTTGDPDKYALNSFELEISDRKGGPVTVWLGGIATVSEPPQGVVTIILDNGWISEYTLAMPTLSHYNFPAVIAEIPETSDNSLFMNVGQLQYLQNTLGWDITCHTWDHVYPLGLPNTSTSIMDSEFSRCKDWLIDNGLGKGANILVWPNGSNSPTATAEAKKYFVVARGIVGTMFNTLPPANPMLLYSTEFGYQTATSTLYADVDRCAANHEWCIFYGHIITSGTAMNQDQFSIASFNDFIAHIAEVGIPVRTMTDVLKNY